MANPQDVTKELIIKSLKASKTLEKKEKYLEALTCLESVSTIQDPKLIELCQNVAIQVSKLCNKLIYQVPNKVTYLRRAEHSLNSWLALSNNIVSSFDEKVIRMMLVTYNNWATFHQTGQNYHMALNYLMKGLQVINETEIEHPDSLQCVAKTKLNVSALYSELHRYEDAITYAEECLKTLQNEFKIRLSGKDYKELFGKEKMKAETMINTYVTAFYNIGVAEEYLNNRDKMIQAFKNAVNIGTPFLDSTNEILISAKKALMEGQSIKSRTLHLSPIKTPVQPMPSERKPKIYTKQHVNLPFSVLGRRATKVEINKEKILSEQKRPGRYYSEARLKKLQEKIDNEEEKNFVSADQYFYREISKLMNISSDIKFLKPLTTSGAMTLWDRQVEEKLKISDLRLKKQHRLGNLNYEPGGILKMQEKIERLKEIDEDVLKKQEIKMKSKMKTKVYKQLVRSISSRNSKYSFPPQRLFFKPPLNHRRSSTENLEDKKLPMHRESILGEKRLANIQNTKDEIENMMAKITGEIKKIDIEKGVAKSPQPDVFITAREISTNKLASSTLKNFTIKKEGLAFFKSSINQALRPEVKTKTSPKVLIKNNSIVSFPST